MPRFLIARFAIFPLLLSVWFGLALPVQAADSPAEEQAIAAIRAAGGQVVPLAQNDPRLEVAFHLSNTQLTPDLFQHLAVINGRMTSLNLRGTNMNDALAAGLAPLTELKRLHLEKTAVTSAALPHLAGMHNLEYLNLYGTSVGDEGLAALKGLSNLKKLYLWETQVSREAEAAFAAASPTLEVIGFPKPPAPPEALEAPRPTVAKPAESQPAK